MNPIVCRLSQDQKKMLGVVLKIKIHTVLYFKHNTSTKEEIKSKTLKICCDLGLLGRDVHTSTDLNRIWAECPFCSPGLAADRRLTGLLKPGWRPPPLTTTTTDELSEGGLSLFLTA